MEPLSVTASVIAVLQAAEAVISVCYNYRSASVGSSWEVSRTLEGTRNLRNVLRILEGIADKAETGAKRENSDLPALAQLCDPKTGSLVQCLETLSSLEKQLTPPSWSGPDGSKRSNLVQALSWPLKKAETERTLEKIEYFKSTLNLAVSLDQTSMIMALRDSTLENFATTHRKEILAWLHASKPTMTVPTTRYTNALKGRHIGTGSWYIHGQDFDRWTKEPNSVSWLWGIPGCGKTVLSAIIIERLTDLCSHVQDHALAYFYFAFDDQALQKVEDMIRSLAAQLCSQCTSIPDCIESLYSKCLEGRLQPAHPTYDMLREMLRQLFGCFNQVFIVLDALDECTERHDLILALEEMAGWQNSELHLLTTSRKELELEECMNTLTKEADRIGIQGMPVEADISSYVLGRLRTDRRLKRWHKTELEEEIAMTLTSKAHGMALLSLPKDLDDTYARILKAIDVEGNYAQVFKMLQLLVGSNEPVTIDEAAETIPIELDETPQVDLERRLVDSDDVLSMCSALVILETQEDDTDGRRTVLRLAHFSIREFLLSTRIQESTVSHWRMDDISCHLFIARLFIAYILFLEVDVDESADPEWLDTQFYVDYPLAAVATSRWPKHLSIAENNEMNIACREIGSQLFTIHSAATRSPLPQLFQTRHCYSCSKLLTEESTWHHWDDVGIRHASLVFTAHHNLPQTTGFLLARHANPNTLFSKFSIDEGRPGYHISATTPLAEASRLGHVKVVKELLMHQADVDLEREECPNALKQACRAGNTKVVRLLLDHGADPNAGLPGSITALGKALIGGYHEPLTDISRLVKMLLEAGANNAEPFRFMLTRISPMEFAAIRSCDISVIKTLLDSGAKGVDGLVASCARRLPEMVLLLLDDGTDVNARASVHSVTKYPLFQFWAGRTALEVACTSNNPAVVRILLNHGADPNLRFPLEESVLEAYLNRSWYYLECEAAPVFVLLLENGADLGLVREDKLTEDGETKYLAVLNRWKAWQVDDSMSPIQVIGDYRQKCDDGCLCAQVQSESNDGWRCYNCRLHT
ncbi:MAG: hypothetical protein Q9199_007582 [Rusavskia elegans]